MDQIISKLRSNNLFIIYILDFLFTLQTSLPAYINSSFLAKFSTEQFVGIIYSISSIATIIAFFKMPKILRKYGSYKMMLWLIILEGLTILTLAFSKNILIIIPAFMINTVSIAIIGFLMDILLEKQSSDKSTGKIRGMFLTTSNLAWIFAPIIIAFVLLDGDYWKIYLISAIILLPIFYIFKNTTVEHGDSEYQKVSLLPAIKQIWNDKNLQNIFIVSFLLQFFFAWMIIYTPIYLHDNLNFDWSILGIVFSVMLFPYVIMELPLGKLADNKYGEKEMLTIGFIITAITTGIMSFITGTNIILWTIILFATRIGACMIEVMSETYFFKKVSSTDVHIISAFRMMKPLAYVISPIIATVAFMIIDIRFIFLVLGFLMFYGVRFSLALVDTN